MRTMRSGRWGMVQLALLVGLATTARAAELRKVESEVLPDGPRSGMVQPYQAVVSPDGAHVYAVSGEFFENDPIVHALARAADGSLTPVDGEPLGFRDYGFYGVAIPADGRHVYAATFTQISIFERDASSGALEPAGSVFGDVSGSVLAMSPDGRNLYVGSGSLLATYARDLSTGALTRTGLENGFVGPSPIEGVGGIAVSPDGRHLYVGSYGAFEGVPGPPPSLSIFARDEASGALTFVEALFEDDAEIARPIHVAVSSDGRHVYVSGSEDGSEDGGGDDVTVFARDDATGALTFLQRATGGGAAEDTEGGIAVSPDGERVVVTGRAFGPCCFRDGISVFRRDPATGLLAHRETVVNDPAPGASDLAWPTSVVFAPDGRDLYVTAGYDSAVTAFRVLPSCPAEPRAACRAPTRSRRSQIVMTDAAQDALSWKWRSGEATTTESFGAPDASTDYAFCVHRESAGTWETLVELVVPAGVSCRGGRPCWRGLGTPAGSAGWVFRDPQRTHDGVAELRLTPGTDGRASAQLRAKGPALPLPELPLPPADRVVAQLATGEGACWGADYSGPPLASDARRFSDASD